MMTNFQKILTNIVKGAKGGQEEVAEILGVSASYISMALSGKRNLSKPLSLKLEKEFNLKSEDLLKIQALEIAGIDSDFFSHLPEPAPRENPTVKDVSKALKNIQKNREEQSIPNAKVNIDNPKIKEVKLIPEKVALGLVSSFFDNEYLKQLEVEYIEVEENFTEDAYKVDAVGESMNDGTNRSLLDGDKFLAKDIPRHQWGEKLVNGGRNLFYILHSERGHMIKEITNHDIDSRTITLHSYNKDKKLYPDFEIQTNHCYIIASIREMLSRKM